jgi:GTP-binding protein HflX
LAVIADTVGFISHLPHQLVTAFQATLEETASANLLLHVVDAEDESHAILREQVNNVLVEIGADSVVQLEIFNKIDLISGTEPHIQRDQDGKPTRVWVSAKTGAGLALLRDAISELLAGAFLVETLIIKPEQARLRSQLYERGFIESEEIEESGVWKLRVRLPKDDLDRILQRGAVLKSTPKLAGDQHKEWLKEEQSRIA